MNLADSASIVATSAVGSLVPDNLKANYKSLVWRSVGLEETLTITLPAYEFVTCVALLWNNLTVEADARVVVSHEGAITHDSGWSLANPPGGFSDFAWGQEGLGQNHHYLRTVAPAYTVVWLPEGTGGSEVTISVRDLQNPAGYIEASRVLVGQHWSPEITADLGVQVHNEDTSRHSRTESGDLRTLQRVRQKSLSFSLSSLNADEGEELATLLRYVGKSSPVLISLYPEHDDVNLERMYQVFGKLATTQPISTPGFNTRQARITAEEL